MNTENTETPKTVEVEVVQDDKLVKFASQTGLEAAKVASLAETFRPLFNKSRAAIDEAKGVAESVKDATCVREIRKARACRLALRAVRLESDETRKREKQSALLYGKAVDGFHNILMADLSPVETALQEAEDTAERAEAARLSALKASREAELRPVTDGPILGDLSELSEEQFAKMLSDAKLLRQAKIEAAAKAEAEAKAKAESDRAERERIAAENARLKAEAEAREATAKAEREAAAAKLAEERAAAEAAAKAAAEKARKEREAIEAKAKAEREAAEAKAREERAAAEAAAKAAAEKARKEREAIEAKAKAEREAAEAKAREERAAAEAAAKKEQARLKAIADEERRKLQEAEAEAQRLRDVEAKRQADAAAAKKKAEAAPDNAKAQAFANALRAMPLPTFQHSPQFANLGNYVESLAKWIEGQIKDGELI
jgi:hypothetical protein